MYIDKFNLRWYTKHDNLKEVIIMKRIICALFLVLFVFSIVACSTGSPVKDYVAKNGKSIARMMEMSFDGLGECDVSANGNDIVVNFFISGTNNASAEFKEQIKGVYESLIPQMRESFTPIKNELPELENIIYNVCEEDGDIMCVVKIDF